MSGSVEAPLDMVADHGGSLTRAARLFPGAPQPWLDLSTGINPHSYPFGKLPASAFARLPEDSRLNELVAAAARVYDAPSAAHVVAAPGTQILLPLVAALVAKGHAAVLSPIYAEHRRVAALMGHETVETEHIEDLKRANLAILVNPNNPDGRVIERATLLDLAACMKAKGSLLIVDEAFMDVQANRESLAPYVEAGGVIVLRSFGKFFGLAGVRLGFAIGPVRLIDRLRAQLGPWAISGPALEIGIAAFADTVWQDAIRRKLKEESARLDAVLTQAGLEIAGGTSLYRFVRTPYAQSVFRSLGNAGILVRAFDSDHDALRFGIPGSDEDFARLGSALSHWRNSKERDS